MFMRSFTLLFTLVCSSLMASSVSIDKILELSLDGYRIVLAPVHQTVLSSQVTSRVIVTEKKMGETFEKGELLVDLDSAVFKANLDKTKAVMERARTQLDAQEQLFKDNVASLFELKDAIASLAVAEADYIIAQQDLEGCSIIAPYSGKVVTVFVDEHEMVQPGQPLIEIVDDRTLVARLLIPSFELPNVSLGQTLRIHVKETNSTVEAKITNIGSVIDPSSSMVKVDAEVDNSTGELRSGMIGNTSLHTIEIENIAVPKEESNEGSMSTRPEVQTSIDL